MGTMITLRAEDGHNFQAYKARHQGNRRGGLVLLQEIFGVTPHIKALCDEFASFGYDVLSPAIFDRIAPDAAFGYEPDDINIAKTYSEQAGLETPMADIQACVDRLGQDGLVAITGFCYGGSLVWMAASRVKSLSCAVGYYGRLIPDHLDEVPKCPTMLHFGEHDASIPLEGVERVREAHPKVDIHIYDADHGFCSDRPQNFNAQAKERALKRTLTFFDTNMG